MRLILLGPQGAGKGTQAHRLAAYTGARHISSGDLVRAEIRIGSSLGLEIQAYNDRGDLVPDELILGLVRAALLTETAWILDGFPRTVAQAMALDASLEEHAAVLDLVVALQARDDDLIARLSGRRQSMATGMVYHLMNNPPPPQDPGPFVQRQDDEPDNIRHRLEIYHAATEPLLHYYAGRGLLVPIDASKPIDQVTNAILEAVTAHVPIVGARKPAASDAWPAVSSWHTMEEAAQPAGSLD